LTQAAMAQVQRVAVIDLTGDSDSDGEAPGPSLKRPRVHAPPHDAPGVQHGAWVQGAQVHELPAGAADAQTLAKEVRRLSDDNKALREYSNQLVQLGDKARQQLQRLLADNTALKAETARANKEAARAGAEAGAAKEEGRRAREVNARLQAEIGTLKASEDALKRQLDAAKAQLECPVCMDGRPNMLLTCGHMVCEACMGKLSICPCCRHKNEVRKARKVFWG